MLNITPTESPNTSSLTFQNTLQTVHNSKNISVPHSSFQDGCIETVFSFNETDFKPWDNADNIVSAETETTLRRIKDFILAVLFLIGGPANVLNMAVFCKQGLKDRVNLVLFALALADELYIVTVFLHDVEQLYLQFTTRERFGPLVTFLSNHRVIGFLGFCFVSLVLSAIVASERCVCVLNPLKFQTLVSTRVMAAVIAVVYVVMLGLFFVVSFRYTVGCARDTVTGAVINIPIDGPVYQNHKRFIDYLDSFVFGAGVPGLTMAVVMITTTITSVKLRQIVTWREGTSTTLSSSSSTTQQEVMLTKMLVGSSILFIICVTPVAVFRFSCLLVPEMNSGRRYQNLYLTGLWVVEVVSCLNSTLNFFVYYTMGSRFRQTLWALLGRKVKSEKSMS